jgi:hypothetical protein
MATETETRDQLRPVPETWLGRCMESVVTVLGPILAAVIYFLFLVLPDQTAEAIRAILEADWWWQVAVLVLWAVLTVCVVIVFQMAAAIALGDLLRNRGSEEFKLDHFQRNVMYAVSLSPIVALWVGFAKGMGQTWHEVFTSWTATPFLLLVTAVGTVLAIALGVTLEKSEFNRRREFGREAAFLSGTAIVAIAVLLFLWLVTRVSGIAMHSLAVPTFAGWTVVVLVALMALGFWARWLAHLAETVVAARGPILAALIYWVFLVLPDQSADAIRSIFETSLGWRIGILILWFLLTFYIVAALFAAIRIAFSDLLRRKGVREFTLDRTQRGIKYAVSLSPILALWIAFANSLGPSWHAVFTSWSTLATPFLLCVTAFGILFARVADFSWGAPKLDRHKKFGREAKLIGFASSIAIVVLIALRIGSLVSGKTLDPPAVLTFTAWMVIVLAVLMLLEFWSNWSGAPVFSLLAIGALGLAAFDLSDNHVVRTVEPGATEPKEIGKAFDDWIAARKTKVEGYRASRRRYPVFLVAAEGGGSRAAYMTTLVLEALRKHCPDAIRHTFLVTAVSGGSVGAILASAGATWESVGSGCQEALPTAPEATTATKAAGEDFLRPALRGLLFGDIPARFIPSSLIPGLTPFFASWSDPAQYLETGIDRAWREYDGSKEEERDHHRLSQKAFGDLWAAGPTGDVPALVLLTTDVATGRRVAVSHLTLRTPFTSEQAKQGKCAERGPHEELESRVRLQTLDDLVTPRIEVSAAAAAILSARFPGMTAPGRLPCSGNQPRLVDGGYFENSGLTTVLELRDELRKRPSADGVSFVIVQIENGRATPDWSFANGDPPPPPANWLPELMSPLRAIAGTREARGDLARKALKTAVPDTEECKAGCDYRLLFELRPCKTPIPLGWSLSEKAREEIRRQLFEASANGAEDACVAGVRENRRPPPGMSNAKVFEQMFRAVRLSQATAVGNSQ